MKQPVHWWVVTLALVLLCWGAGSVSAKQPVFQAGAATSNITPPLGLPIIGSFSPPPAEHVHDELHTRCLVLDDGTSRLAIVVADNLGLPREVGDVARLWIEEEIGIPRTHVLIAATHTHSAATSRRGELSQLLTDNRAVPPEELSDYGRFIARRIADGVHRAVNNLVPARIGFGRTEVPDEVFNRRWFMEAGDSLRNPFGGVDRVRMNPPRMDSKLIRPAGPTDPEVSFLSVQSLEGRPIALVANYSLHYVGGVPRGTISADYFGAFAERMEELFEAESLDPPFVPMMSNGTSGDINNNDYSQPGRRYPAFEKIRKVADRVATAVYAAHEDLSFREKVQLGAEMEEVRLAVRKPTPQQVAYFEAVLDKPEGEAVYHSREKAYAERGFRQADAPDSVDVQVQALRVGSMGITAIPFEVVAEIGLEIKDRSPLKPAFTMSLSNGYYGYLPTPSQHEVGGYETWLGTNLVETEASTKIIDRLLKMLDRLARQ